MHSGPSFSGEFIDGETSHASMCASRSSVSRTDAPKQSWNHVHSRKIRQRARGRKHLAGDESIMRKARKELQEAKDVIVGEKDVLVVPRFGNSRNVEMKTRVSGNPKQLAIFETGPPTLLNCADIVTADFPREMTRQLLIEQ